MFRSIQQHRDYYAGGLLVLVGLGTMYQSSRYEVGSLSEIGPGFFPMVMGVILLLCGIAVAVSGGTETAADDHDEALLAHPEWRAWLCILGGVLSFILLAQNAGLLPATFACVFISAQGDRSMKLKNAFILASAISIFGVLLFHYGLKIQLPPFAWMRS
ncbi:MAG: tripartite tricarboxylate transporter TctB family protein [Beijerinckiaceae bacterium]